MRTVTRLLVPLALLALVLAACGTGGNPTNAAEVNGVAVPLSEIETRFDVVANNPEFAAQLEADEDGTLVTEVQANILTDLIHAKLWQQGAVELGVDVTDADVEERQEQLVEEVGGQEAFDDLVEQSGLSAGMLAAEIRNLVVRERVEEALAADLDITEADIEEAFEERRDRFQQIAARHILVETEEEAQDVLSRLEDDEDFAELAQELSIDTGSGERGGDLGEFGRDEMVPEFEQAAFDAEIGEIVGPVQSQFGFHVIEVLDRTQPTLAEVEDEIRTELLQDQEGEVIEEWFEARLQEADVVVNPRFGEWDADAGEVVSADALGEAEESEDGEEIELEVDE